MKDENGLWGVPPYIIVAEKKAETQIAELEERARTLQPLITEPFPAKVLLGLLGRFCPWVLKDMCSITRDTLRRFIREPLDDLRELLKEPKYLLVCSAELPEVLHEIDIRVRMLNGRIDRVEEVFNLADDRIYDLALAAAKPIE